MEEEKKSTPPSKIRERKKSNSEAKVFFGDHDPQVGRSLTKAELANPPIYPVVCPRQRARGNRSESVQLPETKPNPTQRSDPTR